MYVRFGSPLSMSLDTYCSAIRRLSGRVRRFFETRHVSERDRANSRVPPIGLSDLRADSDG